MEGLNTENSRLTTDNWYEIFQMDSNIACSGIPMDYFPTTGFELSIYANLFRIHDIGGWGMGASKRFVVGTETVFKMPALGKPWLWSCSKEKVIGLLIDINLNQYEIFITFEL